jgi:hypothetical protein
LAGVALLSAAVRFSCLVSILRGRGKSSSIPAGTFQGVLGGLKAFERRTVMASRQLRSGESIDLRSMSISPHSEVHEGAWRERPLAERGRARRQQVQADRDYMDYVREARALRARHLGDLMTNAWYSITNFFRSNNRHLKRHSHNDDVGGLPGPRASHVRWR